MESSNLSPTPEEGPNRLHALPDKAVDKIIKFLTIESDVTASDQTAQRRQNLSRFSLVCKRFHLRAKRYLYRIVRISTDRRLKLFLRTVRSRPETAELVERLSLNLRLCGNIAAGVENHRLCLDMYYTLKCTTKVQRLWLGLMECNCCFRNSGQGDVAVNGANGKLQPVNRISVGTLPTSGRSVSPPIQIVVFFLPEYSFSECGIGLARNTNTILTNHSWIRQLLQENVKTHTERATQRISNTPARSPTLLLQEHRNTLKVCWILCTSSLERDGSVWDIAARSMILDSSFNIATPILTPRPRGRSPSSTPPPPGTLCEYHCPFIFSNLDLLMDRITARKSFSI